MQNCKIENEQSTGSIQVMPTVLGNGQQILLQSLQQQLNANGQSIQVLPLQALHGQGAGTIIVQQQQQPQLKSYNYPMVRRSSISPLPCQISNSLNHKSSTSMATSFKFPPNKRKQRLHRQYNNNNNSNNKMHQISHNSNNRLK